MTGPTGFAVCFHRAENVDVQKFSRGVNVFIGIHCLSCRSVSTTNVYVRARGGSEKA